MPHPRAHPLLRTAAHEGRALPVALASFVVVLTAGLACTKRPVPVPAPPAPTFRVPNGCEQPLQGAFAHEEHRDWQYLAQDDGTALVLEVRRGSLARAEGSPAPSRITLHRTPDGFLGFAQARVGPEGTAGCALEYPTRLVACEEHVLTFEALDELAVDLETCEVAPPDEAATWRTHRLVRLPPPDVLPEDAPPSVPEEGPAEGPGDAAGQGRPDAL